MPVTRAVVLIIDRLGAGFVGPYGNTWLETPNFNRLAAESLLFETALTDSPDLPSYYQSVWTGRHALHHLGDLAAVPHVLLSEPIGHRVLLTDEARVAEHPLAAAFAERHLLPAAPATMSAESIEQTGLFEFFDAARLLVEQSTQPGVVWLHARGMSGPWDAPLELRYQFADEEDPEPPTFVDPPSAVLKGIHDPDLLLGYGQSYAGQVALADMCLGMLLEALAEHPLAHETMLIVSSPRGYPLGEHGRVGDAEPALFSELLQVPLLVRIPEQQPARVRRIIQPAELPGLIQRVFRNRLGDGPVDENTDELLAVTPGGVAYASGPGQRAIRTPAWFLRESQVEGASRSELFAKPDDRWDANEISSLCGEAVELLAAVLARFAAASGDGELARPPQLPELLCDIWR